ncbi:MAG TPA: ABC transporter ATP-binding protein, partial [Spirochaetia bacterium]|nr:ABC transporter ATP-binding protein [Spirochaetia bacterium]
VDPARGGRRFADLIGVQLQSSGLPPTMTVSEAMELFCAYHRIAPRRDLVERLGLGEKQKSQYRQLSTGQQRRLALALAIAHNPRLVLFDEPTAGLDVESRNELHKLMEELRDKGTAIILATHDMSEAEKLSDRIAILLNGKIVAQGTPREITAAGTTFTKISVRSDRSILTQNHVQFPGVERSRSEEGYTVYFSADPGRTVAALLSHLADHADALIDLRVERPSLEERFLEITSNGENR